MKNIYITSGVILIALYSSVVLNAQNIAVNTSGAAAASTNMFEVTQVSTAANMVAIYAINSGANAGTGYGLYSLKSGAATTNIAGYFEATGGTNNYPGIFMGGNVGIGTTVPLAKLQVGGNNPQSTPLISARGSGTPSFEFGHSNPAGYGSTIGATEPNGYAYIAFNAESELILNQFKTRGIMGRVMRSNNAGGILFSRATNVNAGGQTLTDDVIIDGSGNVGIGTITPGAKLEVAGQVKITGGSPALNSVLTSDATGLAIWSTIGGAGGVTTSCGTVNYVPKMTSATNIGCSQIFDNGTNVGIGTATPTSKLHIYGNTGVDIRLEDAAVANAAWRILPQTGNTTKLFRIYDATNAIDRLVIDGAGNTGIGTTTPAYLLDVNGAGGFNAIHKIGPASNNPEAGMWNVLWTAIAAGLPIYPDEEFASGSNSVAVYNNSGGTGVQHFWEAGDGSQPNTSGKWIRIVNNGNPTSPGYGGFYQVINSRRNATFVQRFRAKLPVGYSLNIAENAQGTNNTSYWLTPTAGTGKWEEYVRVSHCGNTGVFSSGGHVYVTGGAAAFTWYLASCNIYEVGSPGTGISNNNYIQNQTAADQVAGFRINGNGLFNGGSVGIGTTSPGQKLEVVGSVYVNNETSGFIVDAGGNSRIGLMKYPGFEGAFTHGNTTPLRFGQVNQASVTGGVFTEQMRIDNSGNVGIGLIPSGTYKVEVNGTLKTTGIKETSDIRWKKDISTIDSALFKVKEMRGVNYSWRVNEFKDKNFETTPQVGLIAQEVEKIFPQLVGTDKDGFKSVEYSKVVAVLIEAIKEQQKIIDDQQLENKNQQTSINDLLSGNKALAEKYNFLMNVLLEKGVIDKPASAQKKK